MGPPHAPLGRGGPLPRAPEPKRRGGGAPPPPPPPRRPPPPPPLASSRSGPLLEPHFELLPDPCLGRAVHHIHLEARPSLLVPLRRHHEDQPALELDLELAQVGPHRHVADRLAAQPCHGSRHAAQLLELE